MQPRQQMQSENQCSLYTVGTSNAAWTVNAKLTAM